MWENVNRCSLEEIVICAAAEDLGRGFNRSLEVDVRDDGNETASVAAADDDGDALYRPFSKRLFSVYI